MIKNLKGNIYIVLFLRLLLIFFLYSLCRIAFLFFNLDSFNGINLKGFFIILLGGLKFDLSAILYTNLLFIASQIIPFRFVYGKTYQKICAYVFFIFNGISLAFNAGDIAYYPFTLKRTTFSVFSQFENEVNLTGLFTKFIFVDYWYISLLFIALIVMMVWMYKKIRLRKPPVKNKFIYYPSSIIIMLLLVWFAIAGMRGGFRHSTRPITISNAGEFVEDPAEINIVINTPFSIIRTIKTKPLKKATYFDNEQQLDSLYNPVKTPDSSNILIKKNVVVLVLESFSREYLGGFNKNLDGGTYKGYTPFLDSLKEVSLSFNNAYANGRKSIEGLPSVLASIPGINEPFVLGFYSANEINSLGGLLGNEGYHTSFFHGAPNGSMGFSSFVKMAGIKNYYGKTEYNNDKDFDGMWGIWDEPFLQYWAQQLNTFKEPFFSNVFTLSSHHPFKLPEEYEGKFPKGTLPVHQNIGYTDMALKKFFQTVSKSPWYKNTLFVITADHSTVAWHEEYKTALGAYAVPIIIFAPSGELKGQVDYPVQQIDIFPTIMNHLHYNKPYFAFGNDMINRDKNNFVINTLDGEHQLIMDDYLLQWSNEKALKLYNYRSDVLLQNNIIDQEPAQKERLEMHLKAFIQQYNKHLIDNSMTVK
jgi:phosphoglycerol transferase MdoB-like AlkP superfamily enzyme